MPPRMLRVCTASGPRSQAQSPPTLARGKLHFFQRLPPLAEMKRIPPKLQPWFDARQRFKLTNAEVQMARELGMNPKKFGALSNERQERWKLPLREFIAACYHKRFGRDAPQQVLSLEEVVAKDEARRVQKREKKQARASVMSSNLPPQ